MMPLKRFLTLFCILVLAMLACSVSVDTGIQQASGQDKVPTAVAQTLQAFTQAALLSIPTSTATPSATPTPSHTPVPPVLSVSAATDCYAGPSTNYGFVITIRPGTTVTVVGKDTADNYWIIDVPGYPGTLCWLSGQYASVVGDTADLAAPATPLASVYTLSEPRNLRLSCSSEEFSGTPEPWWDWDHASIWNVVFRWTNTETEQTGVRVFRNGRQLATLGRNANYFADSFWLHGHHDRDRDFTYGVQAFNNTAVSSIVTIPVRHCE